MHFATPVVYPSILLPSLPLSSFLSLPPSLPPSSPSLLSSFLPPSLPSFLSSSSPSFLHSSLPSFLPSFLPCCLFTRYSSHTTAYFADFLSCFSFPILLSPRVSIACFLLCRADATRWTCTSRPADSRVASSVTCSTSKRLASSTCPAPEVVRCGPSSHFLHRKKNLDSFDCVRLQLDHDALRACNHNALRLHNDTFSRVLSHTKETLFLILYLLEMVFLGSLPKLLIHC